MSGKGINEPFQRLEEFSSFISCIKCYERPIIPPLLTLNDRNELQQIRAAAAEKERGIQERRKQQELLENLEFYESVTIYSSSGSECCIQESSALWYSSSKEYPEGVSTAISKFPTSTIYSSVHTGAIVCSNVIENNHRFASRIAKDPSLNSDNSPTECLECFNSNINCSLCQAEYEHSFHNCSFVSEVYPEVPCRTFSLMESSNMVADDQNSIVDEADFESLPTVIFNDKNAGLDTDNESSITCMTQSTDLDKYMDASCEFSSSEISVSVWDASKSVSEKTSVMSRSDDASSETVINTESGLTPCASAFSKFTDNVEDELRNIEDLECDSDKNNEFAISKLKRAHSIDSYMKILQTNTENANIRKSYSDPLSTNVKILPSSTSDIKAPVFLTTSKLIKEDSKESDESKEAENILINGNNPSTNNENDSMQHGVNSPAKKHLRRNSYTLDHPSSALILAHRDCSCSLASDSLTLPHCSALEDKNVASVNAFMKEKVDITIPVSIQHKYPILNLNSVMEDSPIKELTHTVADEFPVRDEIVSEKLIFENLNAPEKEDISENASTCSLNPGFLSEENNNELNNGRFAQLSICDGDLNHEHVKQIYEELHKQHEIRLKELLDEQQRQWEKVQNEWIEQEKLMFSKMLTQISPGIIETENSILEVTDSVHEREVSSDVTSPPDHRPSTKCSSNKDSVYSSENSFNQDQNLNISPSQSSSYPCCSENYQEQSRASLTPSYEPGKSFLNSPQVSSENTPTSLITNISSTSLGFSYESCEDHCSCSSSSLYNSHQFPPNSAVLLPQCESQPLSAAVSDDSQLNASYHDKSPQRCPSYESHDGNNQHEVYQPNSFSNYVKRNCNLCLVGTQVPTLTRDATKNNNSGSSHCDNSSISCSRKLKFDEIPSKQTDEPILSKKAKSASSPDILRISSTVNNDVSQQLLKDKRRVPFCSIISHGAKNLKNGIGPKHDVSTQYKRIEITPLLAKKLERLPSLVKGYLTRRLLKTERLQNIYKTIEDSYILLANLDEELKLKGENVSEQDLKLRTQLFNQLMSAFYEQYDICIHRSVKEQMRIISESRNFRMKQKFMEQKQVPVTTQGSVSDFSNERKLSSATLKALERKKRSSVNSRTYTIKDFKNFRTRSAIDSRTYTIQDLKNHIKRPCSQSFSKTRVVSPSSIYKVSVGRLSPKRKTASSKSYISSHSVHHKWVP